MQFENRHLKTEGKAVEGGSSTLLTFSTEWSRQNNRANGAIFGVWMFRIARHMPLVIVGDDQDRECFPLPRSHAASHPTILLRLFLDVMPTFVRMSDCIHRGWCADISGVMSVVFGVQREKSAENPDVHIAPDNDVAKIPLNRPDYEIELRPDTP